MSHQSQDAAPGNVAGWQVADAFPAGELQAAISALSAAVGAALLARGGQLATAESCTGGGIAEAITRVAGSSRWFGQGWVTYSNAAKTAALGVPAFALKRHGAVSIPVVRYMAVGALERSGADWAVAVSGIAGPDGGSEDKPVGLVWMAWSGPFGTEAEALVFPGDRAEVRARTIHHVLSRLLVLISAGEAPDPVP